MYHNCSLVRCFDRLMQCLTRKVHCILPCPVKTRSFLNFSCVFASTVMPADRDWHWWLCWECMTQRSESPFAYPGQLHIRQNRRSCVWHPFWRYNLGGWLSCFLDQKSAKIVSFDLNFFFFSTSLSQWDFSHGKFRLPSPRKAICDRVALRTLRCMLGALVFP